MTIFFSIDVETSDTDRQRGLLLSVGIQPIKWTPGMDASLVHLAWYERIDRTEELTRRGWFDGTCKTDTYQWWVQQNDKAQDEAWRDLRLQRFGPSLAAERIINYVDYILSSFGEREAFFVANPVAFDKGWIDDLFSYTHQTNPFHYRSLCLRSMRFGLRKGSNWGSVRDDHPSDIPHHALRDAQAQALDLIDMLKERDG